ncbi:MAG TPA: sulfotransferase [Rhizomicrobium sp.]|nr:sulfotransferase [Rhizomicrobium sp.]
MKLAHAFYTFPFRFDVERMRAEIEPITEAEWRWHPEGFEGNSALPLISTNGGINDDFVAPMKRTEFLDRMPYIAQVLAQFRTLHGRARLMRIEPRKGVPSHMDIRYYWRTHTRVHIPIITHPDIRFHCGREAVHMAAGEAWTFDNWRQHKVVNDTDTRRVHLTFDTYGSTAFWSMARPHGAKVEQAFVPYVPGATPKLVFETHPNPLVMSPSELENELVRFMQDVAAHPQVDRAALAKLEGLLYALNTEWKMLWYSNGPTEQAVPLFSALLKKVSEDIFAVVPADMEMSSNFLSARDILTTIFLELISQKNTVPEVAVTKMPSTKFDRPVFIVSAPRSGSSLLFESLAASEDLWTIGGEGHGQIETIASLMPRNRDFDSNRLTGTDVTPGVAAQVRANYLHALGNSKGQLLREMGGIPPKSVRFLEKTPKNALRIPFLKTIFPDAKFIFLHRDAPANIGSIMEAWSSGSFVTYPKLRGWQGPPWSLLLIPGWRELLGAGPAQIALRQWTTTNAMILDDLEELPADDWCSVRYEDFLADPSSVLERLSAFIGVPYGQGLQAIAANPLRQSGHTVSPPAPNKWLRREAEIRPMLPETALVAARLKDR